MLNNIGASTEPWGTPFLRCQSLLFWPSLVWRVKLQLVSISIMNEAHHVLVQECLQELEVKSTEPDSIIRCSEIKENDAFSPRWKESSMSWVRRVTWSMVDFPWRKPACSFGSFRSASSRRAWRRCSKILYGMQSRAMGRYPFGSPN